jgi:predicted RNA binding protein YcfA (HicA-like mRNA interferase family)
MIRLLESNGWTLARTKGSHRQFKHPNNPNLITVPGKLSTDLKSGTENGILNTAGLKKP